VRAAVKFGSGASLSFSLESSASAVALQALFGDGNLRVIVPEGPGRHWASSNEVGIEAQDAQPAILIEKDFQCMHQEHADPEAYPNPLLN
jgi:hypothetical protein